MEDKDLFTLHTVVSDDLATSSQWNSNYCIDPLIAEYSGFSKCFRRLNMFGDKYFISPDLYRGDTTPDVSEWVDGVSRHEIMQ